MFYIAAYIFQRTSCAFRFISCLYGRLWFPLIALLVNWMTFWLHIKQIVVKLWWITIIKYSQVSFSLCKFICITFQNELQPVWKLIIWYVLFGSVWQYNTIRRKRVSSEMWGRATLCSRRWQEQNTKYIIQYLQNILSATTTSGRWSHCVVNIDSKTYFLNSSQIKDIFSVIC